MSNQKKLNAEEILAALTAIRANIPYLKPAPTPDLPSDTGAVAGGGEALQDFELESLAIAAQSMAEELRTAIDEAKAKVLAQALDVYYTAEELARDPAHADLIPHVEAMRAAFERDFGRPIPPREQSNQDVRQVVE